MDNTSILTGYSIVALRNHFDLSLRQFADKIGYTVQGVIKVESGRGNVSLRLEDAVRNAFDLSDEDVQSLSEIANSNTWVRRRRKQDVNNTLKTKNIPRGSVDLIESGALNYPDDIFIPEMESFYKAVAPLMAKAGRKRR